MRIGISLFRIGSLLLFLGYALMLLGSLSMFGLIIYGVYAIFVESLIFGLSMIGGAVVGTFILRLVSAALMAVGEICLEKSSTQKSGAQRPT